MEFTNGFVPDLVMLSGFSGEGRFQLPVTKVALDDPNDPTSCNHWYRCSKGLLCDDFTCFGFDYTCLLSRVLGNF